MTNQNIIFDAIHRETIREEKTINLIASENYASNDVLKASGSILTNKYAEGYPGRRYYGGCEIVDEIETHANNLAKEVFHADHVNLQPHSGSSANMAVYFSNLQAGDTVLGLNINSGGHLTHGHKLNFSGKLFNAISYNVSPETELLDYDEVEILTQQHKPKMIVVGASAYSRTIDFSKFARIAQNNKALLFVDMAHIAGLIAADLHPSPVPLADIVSSTTHKTLRGPRGGMILCKGDQAAIIDKAVFPGSQGGPLMHIIAAKGICFAEALSPNFKQYQQQVVTNAKIMAKTFKDLGYRIVSDGTDTHLFLVDLRTKNAPDALEKITGALVEEILGKCSIIVNRNLIPFDPERPLITSGIRIGTPAVTTRGFKEQEVSQLVHWIDEAIKNRHNDNFLAKLKKEVEATCNKFPIYEKQ